MEEMLDIVNELDEVVGQATRQAVHQQGKMHRASHIILTNNAGQIFLQLRSATKDVNPNMWDSSAAGHVDAGESYLECAVRELEEELSISLAPDQLAEIGRIEPSEQNGFEFVRIYVAQSDASITLEAGEIDGGQWLTETELEHAMKSPENQFAPSFRVIWEHYRVWQAAR